MRLTALAVALTAALSVCGAEIGVRSVLVERELPVDLADRKVPLGGLSGLSFDAACGLFYAVSDDRGDIAPPRVYVLALQGGDMQPRVVEVITLRRGDGRPFDRGVLDAEAVAMAPDGVLWVSTEGITHSGVPPRILGFRLDGTLVDELDVPPAYLPAGDTGVRSNHGFEGMSLTPDGSMIIAATESALLQDGPIADLDRGTVARLVAFDRASGRVRTERAYRVEPVPDEPVPGTAYRSIGISEILALDSHRVLVMERSFSAGVGNRVRIYVADLRTGDDVTDVAVLPSGVNPVVKKLVADLSEIGIDPDNLEGMTLGPVAADGQPTLVLVADNNFQPSIQRNQLLVLEVEGVTPPTGKRFPARISEIQGAAHTSPLVGRCISEVEGTVTAILGQRSGQAFWLQGSPDDDPATSEGLFVTALDGLDQVAVGDAVRLTGRVQEPSWGMELSVTRLVADGLEVVGRGRELPPPVIVGLGGRRIPSPNIDDDALTAFEPDSDAIDFFESLEGMRLRLLDPVVVGPTSGHGEIVVVGDDGSGVGPRSSRGGVVLTSDNAHPERIIIDDRLVPDPPTAAVGSTLENPVDGVLHYSYGAFKLLNTLPLLEDRAGTAAPPAASTLVAEEEYVTVASFNVENLAFTSTEEKFSAVAEIIVDRLGSPTVLAVEEIQDDTGPNDDGTVTAEKTLGRLVGAVVAAGGPRYDWRQIDPGNNRDGGRPGANIRVALLFDPARVGVVPAVDSHLAANPMVLGSTDSAFADSRKPLAVEIEVDSRRLTVIVCHLRSKGGDDPLFGRRQPPVRSSETQRLPQAELIRLFVEARLSHRPSDRIVILGDLNDFEFSDAVGTLASPPMVNLVNRLPAGERSTYVYQGNSQTLDHIIVSPALAAGAEIEVIHVNADFPATERASDHDPVIARFSVR